ncbi:TIR domain-containing protein [Agriterribacter humi]|uniref:TIR domain-containing protein n=1 Tax=Agriterribacter humi TaxID=1104781 RepID=UPI0012652A77|nr:TIR domain-containing protein [Agriterribacter humi]
MAKRQIFYSFHFDNDVFRVQQIRNMGVLEGNEPVSVNEWETVKRGGDASVKRWIDDTMKYKSCLAVLVGAETSYRKWVKYEIEKAWNDGKAVVGIYIHNIKCPRAGICRQGSNPFEQIFLKDGRRLSSLVKCYNPNSYTAYNDIASNLENWIEDAIKYR